jgi:hypothetical protein
LERELDFTRADGKLPLNHVSKTGATILVNPRTPCNHGDARIRVDLVLEVSP